MIKTAIGFCAAALLCLLQLSCKDSLSLFECQRGMYPLEQQNKDIDPAAPEFIKFRPAQNVSLYYVVIEIGQPAQRIRVALDTGSADLVVPGDSKICPTCNAETPYTPGSTAKDLNKRGFLSYGSGNGTVDAHTDQIKVACSEEVAHEVPFGVITKTENDEASGQTKLEGIMGLAYPLLSGLSIAPKTVFFEEVVKKSEGRLNRVFAVTLCGGRENSSVIFGNIDGRVTPRSSFKWTPIKKEQYYSVDARTIRVRDWEKSGGTWVYKKGAIGVLSEFAPYDPEKGVGIETIVDTGSTMNYFTLDTVQAARQLMIAVYNHFKSEIPETIDESFWSARVGPNFSGIDLAASSIQKFPMLEVVMAGIDKETIELEMGPDTYFKLWDNNKRIFSFREMASGFATSKQILGQVFIENHHVEFDLHNKRIGFASNQNICSSPK